MKPDRFDILVMLSVAALTAAGVFAGMSGGQDGPTPRAEAARIKSEPPAPAVYAKLDGLRDLMESGQVDAAIAPLKALSAEQPAMSEPHALLGEAYSRMQDYPAAMREYRTALMLDPGYVDKKSPKFIGKRIKATQRDGMAGAKAALDRDKDDQPAKAALKDAYYLERMLAGGCE